MIPLKHTEDFKKHGKASVVTIGVFDGVHRGHQSIISECVRQAANRGLPSVVLTFKRNPRELVCGEHPCVITSPARKLEILDGLGVDFMVEVTFTRKFASIEPELFCRGLLRGHLGARKVCVGENFRFGACGRGDVEMLEAEGREQGFDVDVVPLVTIDGLGQLSSTLIRGLISEGRAADVMKGLGRPYSMTGRVIAGHSRGKRLGFPTANMALDREFCLPSDGVYAGRATLEGERYRCAINIGSNPTFGDGEPALEVFLLDFEGDIYGKTLEIEYYGRLRDERAFASEKELVRQIKKDIERIKNTPLGVDDPSL